MGSWLAKKALWSKVEYKLPVRVQIIEETLYQTLISLPHPYMTWRSEFFFLDENSSLI